MIPLYKLEKLPRTQQLRKIAKFFVMAENRLKESSPPELFSPTELAFLKDAAELLAEDKIFSPDKAKPLRETVDVFTAAVLSGKIASTMQEFRRAVNCVKHILLAETGRDQADWDFTVSGGLDSAKRQIFEGMLVYMEDIRSPFNVGAMFRTAESFGVEKIILSSLCADPKHRRAQRTAMGCTDIVPWERRDLFEEPPLPCPVFALETGGIPLADFPFPRRGLLIAGSEELGVSPRALAAADASLGRVSIPTYGAKASLNVSVAFGIAVQKWGNNLRQPQAVDE